MSAYATAKSSIGLLIEEAAAIFSRTLKRFARLAMTTLFAVPALVGSAAIANAEDAAATIAALLAMGARAVLLKGGHLDEGQAVVDRYDDGAVDADFVHDRLALEGHGTGCTLASAIAANLCLGMPLPRAVEAATDYIERALRGGYRPGRGNVVVLDHFGAALAATR